MRKIYIFLLAVTVAICGLALGIIIGKALRVYVSTSLGISVHATELVQYEPLEITPATSPPETYYDCPLTEEFQDYIRTICEENKIPMPLIIAQIQVESQFRADAISTTNDYGLMQINKINHGWLEDKYGITDFLDPYQNVYCGVKILSENFRSYGDLDKALMAYNLGASGAERLWNRGIYSTEYVNKISNAMAMLQIKEGV